MTADTAAGSSEPDPPEPVPESVDHEPGDMVDGETGADLHDRPEVTLAEVVRRLDELADLFTRRLSDDRARRAAVEELTARLHAAEQGPFRQVLHPFVHGVALVMDRLDRYTGPDPEFVASVRDELREVLERYGVREVTVANGFDPASHEAVAVSRDPEAPAGAVLEVRRAGFAHGGWVFRPAQVVVNRDGPE